jgi:hypothetical protein
LPELTQTPRCLVGVPLLPAVEREAFARHGDHLPDRQAVLLGEGEVALVVRRHGHHRAFAVAHQHVVADPDLDLSPVSGWRTKMPVGMPFFSIVAMSASATPPRLHSSMKAASAGCRFAACVASGCSAATAQKVTPMMVSARVVNTHSFSSLPGLAVELVGKGEAHAGALADPVGFCIRS